MKAWEHIEFLNTVITVLLVLLMCSVTLNTMLAFVLCLERKPLTDRLLRRLPRRLRP